MSPTETKTYSPFPMSSAADFPISWQHPDDAQLFWAQDREHSAEPIAPLPFSILVQTTEPGFRAATQAYEMPFAGPRFWRLNTYLYSTMVPVLAPPEELAARGQRTQEKLGAAVARLGELWETEWLPEIKAHRTYGDDQDLQGAALPELLAHLDQILARSTRLWDLHFQILFPTGLAISLFEEYYRDLFSEGTAFDTYRLLAGFDNKSLERDRALWQLSRHAKVSPTIQTILQDYAAGGLPPELEQSSEGRVFLGELHTFLAEFGYGGDPPWIQEPSPILQILRRYMSQPDRDPTVELAAVAAEREEALAQVRGHLQHYPGPVREQFEFLLKAAQVGTVLAEDHAHWIDHRAQTQVLQAFGRRFAAAGVITQPDDLQLLTLDEIRATAAAAPPLDRHALVTERRREMAHFAGITPPPILGTPPSGSPPDNPLTRAGNKFFGTPPQPAVAANEVRGHPGAPGRIRGPARVIHSLSELAKLQPGDVLVAEATGPSWTPLFTIAAAVITDIGGILSHCASVAREYRIPAVVGTVVATQVLQDGQVVEVNGDNGVVTIVA